MKHKSQMHNKHYMKSILSRIKELNVHDWYYYYQIRKNKLENPFVDSIDHFDFIKQYFHDGGKEGVLQSYGLYNFEKSRSPHTNLVFFLGIYLYNNMSCFNLIDSCITVKDDNLFPYIWFLTALFHDFCYKYEKELENYKHIIDLAAKESQSGGWKLHGTMETSR